MKKKPRCTLAPAFSCVTDLRGVHAARCVSGTARTGPGAAADRLAGSRVHPTWSTGCPIPPQGAHLIRYYGWYSNKARGMRRGTRLRVAAEAAAAAAAESPAGLSTGDAAPAPARSSQTWAMLIQRVYEIDPLACPRCSGQMKIVAFLEPPQGDVIEKILRGHRRAAMVGGLGCPSSPRAPPGGQGRVHDPDGDSAASDQPRELTFVDEATFWATC